MEVVSLFFPGRIQSALSGERARVRKRARSVNLRRGTVQRLFLEGGLLRV